MFGKLLEIETGENGKRQFLAKDEVLHEMSGALSIMASPGWVKETAHGLRQASRGGSGANRTLSRDDDL